jgi:hypothetical protein
MADTPRRLDRHHEDFQAVSEEVSGQDLDTFFDV